MLPQRVGLYSGAVVAKIILAVASNNDEHAAAGRAAIGFDDEIAAVAEQTRQTAQHRIGRYLGIDLRRRHANALTQPGHAQLVIDERIQRTRIVIEDEGGIAAIHTEYPQLPKPPRRPEQPKHASPPNASWRTAGVSRLVEPKPAG